MSITTEKSIPTYGEVCSKFYTGCTDVFIMCTDYPISKALNANESTDLLISYDSSVIKTSTIRKTNLFELSMTSCQDMENHNVGFCLHAFMIPGYKLYFNGIFATKSKNNILLSIEFGSGVLSDGFPLKLTTYDEAYFGDVVICLKGYYGVEF